MNPSPDTVAVSPVAALIDGLLQRLSREQYVHVAPLRIERWLTREPVPFAARESGARAAVGVGEPWARHVFDCAWMRFSATLPAGATAEGLIARIDINGEACVVDAAGVPCRGLTCVKSTFDHRLGQPGKTVCRLPAGAVRDGSVELWADAALNDLFSNVPDGGVVALAELCTVRGEVRALYYDLETLWNYHGTLAAGDGLLAKLDTDLTTVAALLEHFVDDADVATARDRLRPWFASTDKPRLEVHAIGHGHLDLAWLWPIRETIRKGTRTLASVIYNLERHPDYRFGCSQPQLFAWIKEQQFALYSKIKDAVRSGGIELQGTFWVEPDCSMPSGESFVRQVLHGARWFREEFGITPDYCWQPDVFGYHGQLPQILRKSGHRHFMTQKLSWNVVNRFPHHSFHWQGIDGTRVLTHMLAEETYNGPAAAHSLRKIADDYAERAVSNHALMVYGIGDGGGGPDAEHLERLKRAPGLPGLPNVRFGTVSEFFRALEGESDAFPIWQGELYLERHQGTLTTQALVKRNNRLCEVALRELEWAAFLAAEAGVAPYPAEALDRCWKEVLLYQFHDILPGSSIKRVYDECNPRYAAILDELHALTAERYAALAKGATVFNSSAWPRAEWIRHDGRWHWAEVPALGAAGLLPAPAIDGTLKADASSLENEHLRVRFNADGFIDSILDKRAGRKVLAPGAVANELVVIADTGDAWDFETDHPNKDVWPYLRRPTARPALHARGWGVDGPVAELSLVWHYGASEIRQTVRLAAGAEQIEFDTHADWRDPATMLRVRFPLAVNAPEASFEIPFGHIRRSTLDDTLVRRAQIEVAALQWVDLSDETGGAALYNDCKHGFRVKGNVIDMALIRSVPHPGNALIGKDDVSAADAGEKVYGDLGAHTFRYALRPHGADVDAAALTAGARAFNTPLTVFAGTGTGRLPATPRIEGAQIEVAAVKPAEDGRGWVWRLVNTTGRQVDAAFVADGVWSECDLVETVIAPLPADADGRHALRFGPFEIKTVRTGA
ncbi:MAG: glycoside hydrolase family 38 C-terminal domain-containing protein [Verrucomicrobiota bacterium]